MTWRLARFFVALFALGVLPTAAEAQRSAVDPGLFRPGDRVVFIGNTYAERLSLFPHFEAELTARHPDLGLTFRNLGWSGDEITLMPRPLNFGDLHTHLEEQRADVILAFFGMNESFAGLAAIPDFRTELEAFLASLLERRYNGSDPPRVVLVSPIAQERVDRVRVDAAVRNEVLEAYVRAMREVAEGSGVGFVDLFTPTRALAAEPGPEPLTINGIHPNDRGYWVTGRMMLTALGLADATRLAADIDLARNCPETPIAAGARRLVGAIEAKNELFFLRWRAVNGEYIYGRRREPFGVVNFPGEMQQLEAMIAEREREILDLARSIAGEAPSAGSRVCPVTARSR